MANTTSHKRGHSVRITRMPHEQGCWIRYQLNLRGITLREVADTVELAGCTVSDFLLGRNTSARAKAALKEALGYRSFDELLAAATKAAAYEKGLGRPA